MRRSITFGLLCAGLAALAGSGCRSNAEWYGVWEGDLDRVKASMPDDSIRNTINYMRLTMRRDMTFDMEESGMFKSGTYRIVDGKALLTITHVMERRIEQLGSGAEEMNLDLTGELQDDGSMLYRDPGGFDDKYIRLVKRAQPADGE